MMASATGPGRHRALDLAGALASLGAEVTLATGPRAQARRSALRELRPDVLHLEQGSPVALELDVPKVLAWQGSPGGRWEAATGRPLPGRLAHRQALALSALRAADAVVVPTVAQAQQLEREQGATGRLRVLPAGVDTERCRPLRKHPVVLAVGRTWDPVSELALLEPLAASLAQTSPSWAVMVAEDRRSPCPASPWRPAGARHLHRLGSLSREALGVTLGHASIFCHPSRSEPAHGLILEAAACAAALVLADQPALRERWEGAAVFVEPGDAHALERAVRSLLEDPLRRGTLGAHARRRALRFPLREEARALLGLYRELTGSGRGRSDPQPEAVTAPAASAGWR